MKRILYYKATILIVCFCSFANVAAQLSTNEKPISFGRASEMQVKQISANPVVTMPLLDMAKIEKEDREDEEYDMPPRFGYRHKVNYNLTNSGTWYELPNGDRLWQLDVVCPNALSVNFCYDMFWIPEGGKFFVYSKDKKYSIGAFTSRNNKGSRENIRGFATGIVLGDDVMLEYYQPRDVSADAIISIEYVVHGYREIPLLRKGFGEAGNCMVNINCEEGENWQYEKNAIAMILANGNRCCTGSLINTTNLSQTPFFLTANHFIKKHGDAVNDSILDYFTFWWNYEMPGCVNDSIEPTYYSTSGAVIVANNIEPDFALLKLTEDPQSLSNYVPFYLGWDNSGDSGAPGVCIHHPACDVKKISTVFDQPESSSWPSTGELFYSHWKVKWRETLNGHGTTRGGSSGSPLLNSTHKVIGQLHGSNGQTCLGMNAYSLYGKFDVSWVGNGNDSIQRRMDCWLDSMNTGVQTMEGLLIIPNARTMTTNRPLYSNVRITDTGQLTIQSDIELMGNSRVKVEAGGRLIIDGGIFSNVDLDLEPGASLCIINGGVMETRSGFQAPVGAKVEVINGKIKQAL